MTLYFFFFVWTLEIFEDFFFKENVQTLELNWIMRCQMFPFKTQQWTTRKTEKYQHLIIHFVVVVLYSFTSLLFPIVYFTFLFSQLFLILSMTFPDPFALLLCCVLRGAGLRPSLLNVFCLHCIVIRATHSRLLSTIFATDIFVIQLK